MKKYKNHYPLVLDIVFALADDGDRKKSTELSRSSG
jgi:hypothetical protein